MYCSEDLEGMVNEKKVSSHDSGAEGYSIQLESLED
jgi:hypothetical protein